MPNVEEAILMYDETMVGPYSIEEINAFVETVKNLTQSLKKTRRGKRDELNELIINLPVLEGELCEGSKEAYDGVKKVLELLRALGVNENSKKTEWAEAYAEIEAFAFKEDSN